MKILEGSKVSNHVSIVRDGVEASEFLKRTGPFALAKRPDLIFLDLNLPRKDGREILREVKEDPALCDIPVIVLTTSNWDQDVNEAYDHHANLYMVKPTDLDQFLTAMKYVEEVWLKTISPSKK
jgi:CheY-like chemotaxis protein